jgi:uncharacterized protein (UPF0264 family)
MEEVRVLVELGVDIIDIKNPLEGSLGAQPPWVVREIAEYVRSHGSALSAALGDLPFKPGTASLAAYGLAQLGVQYIKAGLHGARSCEQAVEFLTAIHRAIEMVDKSTALVAAGYADYRSFDGLKPFDLVRAAERSSCRIVMLDTADKRRGGLFDWMSVQELEGFIACAHEAELVVALAGSVAAKDLAALRRLGPDIIGVRGVLCRTGDRTQKIEPCRAKLFLEAARSAEARVDPATCA